MNNRKNVVLVREMAKISQKTAGRPCFLQMERKRMNYTDGQALPGMQKAPAGPGQPGQGLWRKQRGMGNQLSFRSPSLIQPIFRSISQNRTLRTAGRTRQSRTIAAQSQGVMAALVPAAMSLTQPV